MDQALLRDVLAMGIDRVKISLAVQYVDHKLVQNDQYERRQPGVNLRAVMLVLHARRFRLPRHNYRQKGTHRTYPHMASEWDLISKNLWLALSEEALRHVSNIVARQAEKLTEAMAWDGIADDGPGAALRLLATELRAIAISSPEPVQRLH